MPGIASAATAVVIGHVAAGTKTIRVGSGGIMLPNHAPLVIAEQFGTLASLFPGRIDLGLGRAPGTDPRTMHALRRTGPLRSAPTRSRATCSSCSATSPTGAGQAVRAVPGEGLHVPIWLLGSSLYGAQLAGKLGLPFAFASHFAPEARLLATSLEQAFVALRTGKPRPLPRPKPNLELSSLERRLLDDVFACAVVGDEGTVRRGLHAFAERTKADELIVTAQIWDDEARVRSLEITARAASLDPRPRAV
jgi:alkanesulfonate monooxygenase SsuD/methylene tetrahydromethanopterin reductase-like flavin-dependent oxidoreductase (luciferase family)